MSPFFSLTLSLSPPLSVKLYGCIVHKHWKVVCGFGKCLTYIGSACTVYIGIFEFRFLFLTLPLAFPPLNLFITVHHHNHHRHHHQSFISFLLTQP